MLKIICALINIGCVQPRQAPSTYYNPGIRMVLPIESFGANWKIKNFRKHVLFPGYFELALARAIDSANTYKGPVNITAAPVEWHACSIDLTKLTKTLELPNSTLWLGGPKCSVYKNGVLGMLR